MHKRPARFHRFVELPKVSNPVGTTSASSAAATTVQRDQHLEVGQDIALLGYLFGVGAGGSPGLKIFAPIASSTRALRSRKRLTP